MFTCSTCKMQFHVKGVYNAHTRKCIPVSTFTAHSGQRVTVERNEGGVFLCYCSHPGCPKPTGYLTVDSIKNHMKKVQSTWIGRTELEGEQGAVTPKTPSSSPLSSLTQTKGTSDDAVMGSPSLSISSILISPKSHKDFDMRSWSPRSPSWLRPVQTLRSISEEQCPATCTTTGMTVSAPKAAHVSAKSSSKWSSSDDGLLHHPYLDTLNLVVNEEFRLLMCQDIKCGVALLQQEDVIIHLTCEHPGALQIDHEEFTQAINEMTPPLAREFPQCVQGPRSKVPGLSLHDAFGCHHCPALALSEHNLLSHHYKRHKDTPRPQFWRRCKAQRIQTRSTAIHGAHQTLWEVDMLEERSAAPPSKKSLVESLLKELEEEERLRDASIAATPDKRLVTPWLATTRWHEYIAGTGHTTEFLCDLMAIPKDDDQTLSGLRSEVDSYYQDALDLLPITDELVLKRLNSPRPLRDGISNTPLHRHMLDKTMAEYVRPVVALLVMLTKTGSSADPEVNQAIHRLADALQNTSHHDPDHPRKGLLSKHIHNLLTAVWTKAWKHDRKEATAKKPFTIVDPTERCLALMTLKSDGSLKEPKHVTTIIAKLEYCMRLTFLREIRARVDVKDDNDSMAAAAAAEDVACDALQDWFVENKHSTFSRLRSLQHCASTIAYDTTSLPNIWWMDTVHWKSMLFKGNPIHFEDLCQMFTDTETKLIELWEQKVLGGLPLKSLMAEYHHLDRIADDLTNKSVGYTFISDQRNKVFKEVRGHLIEQIVEGNSAFKHYAVLTCRQQQPELDSDSDSDAGGYEIKWNERALRAWLRNYAEMHQLLLLRAEMLSGAPSRGTELTALTYRNTKTRPTRGLVMLGNHLTILCQYMKTTALTGQDKLIPHALDAVTSDILIQDLALARPFAEIAARAYFPGQPQVAELYRDHLFVNFNRLFTSEDLSATMTQHSLPRLNYSLTINPWRHIQTAWKRKFRCSSETVREEDMVDNVEALQAGHTRATENRIYGLTVHTLAGAPEDVLPFYLQASTTWQKQCQIVPGGTLLPYHQARSTRAEALSNTHHAPLTACRDILVAQQVVTLLTPSLSKLVRDTVTEVVLSLLDIKGHTGTTVSSPPPPRSTAMVDEGQGQNIGPMGRVGRKCWNINIQGANR
ncbi:hypothetical protein L210DRAFT_3511762 [Boletus edulis BED1]|uniref:C2H2-type domain-containing protein n=1 Tax=Boletus edulis BED1 TaxID=1328754 RepID=A0AAD4BBZ7_BOLED|nr:hypothetical protein L210DRAFT_3511762 [Boletus edulis BED1]